MIGLRHRRVVDRFKLAVATIGINHYGYYYDTIGNRLWSTDNIITNSYTANSLNQYTTVGRAAPSSPQTSLLYDADGNMTRDGAYTYSYDAENRLRTVTSRSMTNGALRVLNAYDHRNRRIRKIVQRLHSTSAPPPAPPTGTDEWLTLETHTFVWDGNDIVLEKVDFADGTTRTFEYFWGLDKSGTEQGAGGVGGLLAVSVDGVFYIPCYDHNGNIVLYVSETGGIAAQYTYDPYGNIIESSGPLADVFSFGFSTKYHDRETDMVNFQQRVYAPVLGRWLNRDPIEEEGGENLYCFVINSPIMYFDPMGLHSFKFTDSGWSYDELFLGTKVTKGGNSVASNTVGVTEYVLNKGFSCSCKGGRYSPNYTFEMEVYTLIQNADHSVWEDDKYGETRSDPRVKNNWNSFWFFAARRRISLVVEHEERHRKHAKKNYELVRKELDVIEYYSTRLECELAAERNLNAAMIILYKMEKADGDKVERGEL